MNFPRDVIPDTPEYNEALALAIFQTNSIAAGSNVGIFPRMARFNHGCSSAFNSVYTWREKEGFLVAHALKAIKKGEVREALMIAFVQIILIILRPSRSYLRPIRTLNGQETRAGMRPCDVYCTC